MKLLLLISLLLNIALFSALTVKVKYWDAKVRQAYAYKSLSAHLYRLAGGIDEETVVFLGSSTVQGLHTGDVIASAMNLGIGGEKIIPLRDRVLTYERLEHAKAIVTIAGFNDVCEGGLVAWERFSSLMAVIPEQLPIVVTGMQPAMSQALCAGLQVELVIYNGKLREYCQQRGNCVFADISASLDAARQNQKASLLSYFEDDGIHLSQAGYRVLVKLIQQS